MTTLLLMTAAIWSAPVTITVNADSGRVPISPWIYGSNTKLDSSDLPVVRESGIRIMRANDGNNSTKYNWRNGLSSAPDWYNNVYANDWDSRVKSIHDQLPGVQGVFAFQLLGWVAANTKNNFGDWAYNQSAWWSGTTQNLAGGGTVDPNGSGKALAGGDATKYLTPWPADSTAGILDHWFGPNGLGYDSTRLRYWNMDNEADGWSGTHDDVVPALTGHILSAEEFVQRWVAVAKAVRKKFPGARLVGPASMSEWQWYTWENKGVDYKGKSLCFPEYFIKRLAEIQDSTGVRMIDVYDIHLYFNVPDDATLAQNLQTHRLLYDTTFVSPWANGVKTVNGGWDETQTREFIFGRIRGWLDRYFGPGNGIGVGSTESGIGDPVTNDASAAAVWHASMTGTMADNGTELYTPWFWAPGMYESVHLFSRYAQPNRVASRSDLDSIVSAYSSVSNAGDSLTAIVVNRDAQTARDVSFRLEGFAAEPSATIRQLSKLSGETFKSHQDNALVVSSLTLDNGTFSISLPALSVTAIQFHGKGKPVSVKPAPPSPPRTGRIGRNGRNLVVTEMSFGTFELLESDGHVVRSADPTSGSATLSTQGLPLGVYLARWPGGSAKVFVLR